MLKGEVENESLLDDEVSKRISEILDSDFLPKRVVEGYGDSPLNEDR